MSAKQGFALAQNNLAFCYERGEGVEKDLEKAIELYTEAACQGIERAIERLDFFENQKGFFYKGDGKYL